MKKYLLKSHVLCYLFMLACVGNIDDEKDKIDKTTLMMDEKINDTPLDTLILWSRKELKMEGISIMDDTLKFITPVKQLYYPLGKFKRIENLMNNFPTLKLDKRLSDSLGISRIIFKHSYLKFLGDEETGNLEIIYAAIIDSGIKFTNNIEVGISARQFYDIFFIRPVRLDKIRVVKVESALSGIIHYYYIKNDKLIQIEIDSDYQIDKN